MLKKQSNFWIYLDVILYFATVVDLPPHLKSLRKELILRGEFQYSFLWLNVLPGISQECKFFLRENFKWMVLNFDVFYINSPLRVFWGKGVSKYSEKSNEFSTIKCNFSKVYKKLFLESFFIVDVNKVVLHYKFWESCRNLNDLLRCLHNHQKILEVTVRLYRFLPINFNGTNSTNLSKNLFIKTFIKFLQVPQWRLK